MDPVDAAVTRPHAEIDGDGPMLLCLHGIGSSSQSFDAQRAAFAGAYRVVAWDAPGYRRSAAPGRRLTLGEYADLAAAIVRREAGPAGRAAVLGMSWGGVIALRLALDHPEVVDRLILGDSTPGSGTDADRAAAMRARVPELVELGPRAFAGLRAPRLLRAGAPGSEIEAVADAMATTITVPGYASAAESMAATDLTPELPRVGVPALVLYGAEDRVTGRAAAQVLAAGIPGACLAEIPGAGHLANQEAPEAFNRVLAEFLVRPAASTGGRSKL